MLTVEEKHILNELYRGIAIAYTKFLTSIDWNDTIFLAGIREGLNKFVANAYLGALKAMNPKEKRFATEYISLEALAQIKKSNLKDLVFEHSVPKQKYIFDPCIEQATQGTLTPEFVYNRFKEYMITTTITKNENERLKKYKDRMPVDWDMKNLFARYDAVGISYQENPYFPSILHRYSSSC